MKYFQTQLMLEHYAAKLTWKIKSRTKWHEHGLNMLL